MGKYKHTEQEVLWQVSIDDESLKRTGHIDSILPSRLTKIHSPSKEEKTELINKLFLDLERDGLDLNNRSVPKGVTAEQWEELVSQHFTVDNPLHNLVLLGSYQEIITHSLHNAVQELSSSQINPDNYIAKLALLHSTYSITPLESSCLYFIRHQLKDKDGKLVGILSGAVHVSAPVPDNKPPIYKVEFAECVFNAYSPQAALVFPVLYNRSVIVDTVNKQLPNVSRQTKDEVVSQLVRYSDQLSIVQIDDFISKLTPTLVLLNSEKHTSDLGSAAEIAMLYAAHPFYQSQYIPNEKISRLYFERFTQHINNEALVSKLKALVLPRLHLLSGVKLQELLNIVLVLYQVELTIPNASEDDVAAAVVDQINIHDYETHTTFAKSGATPSFKTAKWYRSSTNAVKPSQSQAAILAEIEMFYSMEARDLKQQLGDDPERNYDLQSSNFSAVKHFIETSKKNYNDFSGYLEDFLSEREIAALDNLHRGSSEVEDDHSNSSLYDTSSESDIDEKEARRRKIRAVYSRQVLNSIHAYRWFNAEQPFYQSIKREYRAITARSVKNEWDGWFEVQRQALKTLLVVHSGKESIDAEIDRINEAISTEQRQLKWWAFMRKNRLRKFMRVLGEFHKQYHMHASATQADYPAPSTSIAASVYAENDLGESEPPFIRSRHGPAKIPPTGKTNKENQAVVAAIVKPALDHEQIRTEVNAAEPVFSFYSIRISQ